VNERLWELFSRFVELDTSVRPGETRVEAQDERLRAFMTDAAAPALEELGASVTLDEANNLLARFGPETGAELLFVAYPATHHGNEMEEPLRPRERDGHWVGLGASQGKGGLASVCAAVAHLREQGVDPAGRLAVAVSSEGSSSHASSEVLYRGFETLPAGAVLVVGTGNRITLGNRGRVDVVVRVEGRATHSSAAGPGDNPIPVVAEVLRRLERLPAEPVTHPELGSSSLVVYRLQCGPVAPHTIPAWCELVLDRRILPGEEPDDATAEIRDALAGLPLTVTRAATMLPALVAPDATVVTALQAGAREALGRPLETLYRRDTFDAGYPCSLGVPTVMCGPSTSDFGGHGVLGEDAVDPQALRDAAAVFAAAAASSERPR
jgi:acetylornithine deacetylase/succinyl-diaminopimelate desuccinylase-like protein